MNNVREITSIDLPSSDAHELIKIAAIKMNFSVSHDSNDILVLESIDDDCKLLIEFPKDLKRVIFNFDEKCTPFQVDKYLKSFTNSLYNKAEIEPAQQSKTRVIYKNGVLINEAEGTAHINKDDANKDTTIDYNEAFEQTNWKKAQQNKTKSTISPVQISPTTKIEDSSYTKKGYALVKFYIGLFKFVGALSLFAAVFLPIMMHEINKKENNDYQHADTNIDVTIYAGIIGYCIGSAILAFFLSQLLRLIHDTKMQNDFIENRLNMIIQHLKSK